MFFVNDYFLKIQLVRILYEKLALPLHYNNYNTEHKIISSNKIIKFQMEFLKFFSKPLRR